MKVMQIVRGVICGKTIELADDTGLADGQEVAVTVQPIVRQLPPGEGLRRSAGAWQESAEDLDNYLEWNRQQRKASRREIEP
jgi:hypothetical protein